MHSLLTEVFLQHLQIPLAVIEGIICGLVAKYIVRVKPDILKKLGIIEDAEIAKIQEEAA